LVPTIVRLGCRRTIRFRTIARLRRWRTIRLGSVRLIWFRTIVGWLPADDSIPDDCSAAPLADDSIPDDCSAARRRTIRLGSVSVIWFRTIVSAGPAGGRFASGLFG